MSRYITTEERRQIMERAKGRCEYCQCWSQYAAKSFEVEHIIPTVKGGTDDLDNLAFSCGGCNSHKYDKISAFDPIDEVEISLFNPRRQKWEEHFKWSEDATQI